MLALAKGREYNLPERSVHCLPSSECGIRCGEQRSRLNDFGKRFGHRIKTRNQAPHESDAPVKFALLRIDSMKRTKTLKMEELFILAQAGPALWRGL